MKKIALVFAIALITLVGCKNEEKKEVVVEEDTTEMDSIVADIHNSQTSLDWAGVYEGTTPCASCEGIKTILQLNNDDTFSLSQSYLGKQPEGQSFDDTGSFTWDDSGSTITLKAQGTTIKFKVGENQVTMLDESGNINSGDLADFYILKKQ